MNELDRLCRAEWGRLLSALIRAVGDFDLAEEALQEAFASAVVAWKASVPEHPRAWLYGAARHKALDRLRRERLLASKQAEILLESQLDAPLASAATDEDSVPDERLRLIFTCCHPALNAESQVALTLRTLCGLSTEEIARAFLLPPSTMAQRLVRAKAKIRAARIPYRVPVPSELPARLDQVMSVLYLVFNEGYGAAQGESLVRGSLSSEAIRLARILCSLLPESERPAELDALLALMLLHDARRDARVDASGELVLLADQDRTLWDRATISEGSALVQGALARSLPGPYALEAAIAALHAEAERAEDTDWAQIAALYGRLQALHPSPVVALNRAVAVAMACGADAALPLVEALGASLASYHLWHATRADLLRRLERPSEAQASYERALELCRNQAERRFLARRLSELGPRA